MITAGLLYLGLFALAAGMARHAPALLGGWSAAPLAGRLPAIGWTLVALSLLATLAAADWPVALVRWVGLLPAMAGIILLGLTYHTSIPRAGVVVAAGLVLLGLYIT